MLAYSTQVYAGTAGTLTVRCVADIRLTLTTGQSASQHDRVGVGLAFGVAMATTWYHVKPFKAMGPIV